MWLVYTDCSDYFRNGFREDGVYELTPDKSNPEQKINVYCNMTNGGWTVIMKRESKSKHVNFEQDLKGYKRGFGAITGDHFLGFNHLKKTQNVRVFNSEKERKMRNRFKFSQREIKYQRNNINLVN